jgi:SAM-dependent methyltransferase
VQQVQHTHENTGNNPRFIHGNILKLPEMAAFDVVLCRGVLNDLCDPSERQRAFHEFARVLHPNGLLVFDVREWARTAERHTQTREFIKTVTTERGILTFRSTTTLDFSKRQMNIHEQHVLRSDQGETERTYEFVMQCWAQEEVLDSLRAAHFQVAGEWGAYDEHVTPGMTDRIVICARLLAHGGRCVHP